MSPVYLNPPPSSPIPFLEFKGDQLNTLQVLGQIRDLATSSSYSSLSYSNSLVASDESLAIEYSSYPQEIKVENVLSHDKPNDLGQVLQSSPWAQNMVVENGNECSYGYSSNHIDRDKMEIVTNNSDLKNSRKWKPSKVRIMQKMVPTTKNIGEQKLHHDPEQQQQSNGFRNNNNGGIRVCSDCHTTTTPLWRSGPQGPKSLCNACGIRQRKARRAAMAAAEAAAGFPKEGVEPSMCVEAKAPREEMVESSGFDNKNHTLPLKKRGKKTLFDAARNHNNSCNNGLISSSKDYLTAANSQRSFPRDEEEGAILLMALSCGLACSS